MLQSILGTKHTHATSYIELGPISVSGDSPPALSPGETDGETRNLHHFVSE